MKFLTAAFEKLRVSIKSQNTLSDSICITSPYEAYTHVSLILIAYFFMEPQMNTDGEGGTLHADPSISVHRCSSVVASSLALLECINAREQAGPEGWIRRAVARQSPLSPADDWPANLADRRLVQQRRPLYPALEPYRVGRSHRPGPHHQAAAAISGRAVGRRRSRPLQPQSHHDLGRPAARGAGLRLSLRQSARTGVDRLPAR